MYFETSAESSSPGSFTKTIFFMNRMSVPPLNVHVETLSPSVTISGGEVFGRGLAHENEALVNKISTLTKRLRGVPESLLPSRRWPSMTQHAALA